MEKILIVDLGSQYTQLIARRVREHKVFSEVVQHTLQPNDIDESVKGIILSGGPSSVYDSEAPRVNNQLFDLGIPILGICYGMQLIVKAFGGEVEPAPEREYGRTIFKQVCGGELFAGLDETFPVWMSHGDKVTQPYGGFFVVGTTDSTTYAAVESPHNKVYGLQFHPEVHHTEGGSRILFNFVRNICECKEEFSMEDFIERSVKEIREKVGDSTVVCGLSGGVDSSVAAALIEKAIGDQLHCIFVDHGLLRMNEAEEVTSVFKPMMDQRFHHLDVSDVCLEELYYVKDPEKKRKIIGKMFIDAFQEYVEIIFDEGEVKFLAQGTLYPDVIESMPAFGGPTHVIKSHHNVGGLPDTLKLELLEPLRMLFRDEVRELGLKLGLPEHIVFRQPFPGPGLAIRIIGDINADNIEMLERADYIVRQELDKGTTAWQYFAVLLADVKSVGVMGDKRTYENVCVIRAVDSTDGMTANVTKIDWDRLTNMADRIVNEVPGINRVCYDITSKPPGTIEWE